MWLYIVSDSHTKVDEIRQRNSTELNRTERGMLYRPPSPDCGSGMIGRGLPDHLELGHHDQVGGRVDDGGMGNLQAVMWISYFFYTKQLLN